MTDDLASATREALGLDAVPVLAALPAAGSDRLYWRVFLPGGARCLVSRHQGLRAENRNFPALARLLADRGLRVPKILAENPEARLLWLEDLGDHSLFQAFAPESEPGARLAAGKAAVEELARLHSLALDAGLSALCQPQFDASLYRWEQDYFFEHLAGTHLKLPPGTIARCRAHPALADLADFLAALPRVPIHRDFQSQNVLLQPDGRAALIDFQGIRAGLAEYDLASLLLDPYTSLPAGTAETLFLHYHAVRGTDPESSRPLLQACAIQRLMQALGAYGNLGHRLGKPRYLDFIPTALKRLKSAAAGHPAADALADCLGA